MPVTPKRARELALAQENAAHARANAPLLRKQPTAKKSQKSPSLRQKDPSEAPGWLVAPR